MKLQLKKNSMNPEASLILPPLVLLIVFAVWLFAIDGTAATIPPATQITFATPTEAGQALMAANQANDEDKLRNILGPDSQDVISSGDPTEDRSARQSFVKKYDQMSRWVTMTDGSQVLYIGADNYPFPIPLAQNSSSQWYFDTDAGKEEILARRIGRNELLAMDASSAIVGAEHQYYQTAHNGSPAHQYTLRIVSTAGKRDGLYWPASPSQAASPLGILAELPKSSLPSLSPGKPFVIDGYTLRIAKAQDDSAPGGAKGFTANGQITGGFSVLATPIKYGVTGIMTFMTGGDGKLYEQNLGPDTATIAASIQEFTDTNDWRPVE